MKDRNIAEYFSKEAIAKRQAARQAEKQAWDAKIAKATLRNEEMKKDKVELDTWLHTRNQGDKFGQGENRFGPEDMDDLGAHGSKLLGDTDHIDV